MQSNQKQQQMLPTSEAALQKLEEARKNVKLLFAPRQNGKSNGLLAEILTNTLPKNSG